MAVVEFDIKDFEKATKLSKDKIIDGLTTIGAPCEENKEAGSIIIELTPNRPDWFSFEGLVRSLRAYYFDEITQYNCKKGKYIVEVDKSVSKIRPYTVCAVVKNLEMDDKRIADIMQVQEKLCATLGRWRAKFAMGIYPLDRISFPLKYTTLKPEDIKYQPLGYGKVADGLEIIAKHEKGVAFGHIIKDLARWPVYLDSNNEVMAILPLINSAKTGQVDLETRDVFIEVTGIDEQSINYALNILVTMFSDMGGEIFTVDIGYPDKNAATPELKNRKMKLDLKKVQGILGIEIDKKKAESLLLRMGYPMQNGEVVIPPYRADIIGDIDIIEDIAIAYGYNNFDASIPDFFTPGEMNRTQDTEHAIMRGMGFLEITTFILTNQNKVASVGYPKKVLEITNPSGEEFTCVRPILIVDMLNTFAINKTKGLPQKFYEIGIAYEDGNMLNKLCFGIVDKRIDFSSAKGYLQTLMDEREIEFVLKNTTNPAFDEERSGDIFVNKRKVGVFGKVKREVLDQYRIDFEGYICEMVL
jgi:phenylalanyl-tRNA synthetase beta chain